ncbi:MAG: hypothetical protein WB809_04115 [Thermoplasmata archaeon]
MSLDALRGGPAPYRVGVSAVAPAVDPGSGGRHFPPAPPQSVGFNATEHRSQRAENIRQTWEAALPFPGRLLGRPEIGTLA